MVIGLNRARLAPEGDRFAEVAAIAPELAKMKDPRERARFGLNLAAQASALGPGPTGSSTNRWTPPAPPPRRFPMTGCSPRPWTGLVPSTRAMAVPPRPCV